MKAIIQRVSQASVSVDNQVISSIGKGLCVLIGIKADDTSADVDYIVRKILNIKIFEKDDKRWLASVLDKQYEILCVSQFTLYYVMKGNRLDFHKAMPAQESLILYKELLEKLGKSYKPECIKEGKFGTKMDVRIHNDGPVTIEIESPVKDKSS